MSLKVLCVQSDIGRAEWAEAVSYEGNLYLPLVWTPGHNLAVIVCLGNVCRVFLIFVFSRGPAML